MSAIGSVPAAARPVGPAMMDAPGTATVSTLPATQVDGMQDGLARLLACLSAMQSERSELAKHQVSLARSGQEIEQLRRQKELAAAERAARARDKGGVFGWIKKDIGVLGVVGLCTFNYGLVAADVALHKTGAVKDLKLDLADGFCASLAYLKPELLVADILLRKLDIAPHEIEQALDEIGLGRSVPGVSDEDVKPIVDKLVVLNMMIAGTAASILTAGSTTALVIALVGAAMSAGSFASSELGGPEALTKGLALGGIAASLTGGIVGGVGAATNAGNAGRIAAAHAAASAVSGVNATVGGIDTILAGERQADVDAHLRTATEAKNELAKLQRLVDTLIDTLREGKETQKRMTEAVQSLLQTYDDSLMTAATIKA